MENLKEQEVSEGLKAATETSALETPEAKEFLESTENVLLNSLETLSPPEKLDTFRELESTSADLEGRNPRIVENGTLGGETFRSSEEIVEIDKEQLAEMRNLDEPRVSDLKKHIFSTAEVRLNHGEPVSFGRSCYDKCIDDDVKSGDCRYG